MYGSKLMEWSADDGLERWEEKTLTCNEFSIWYTFFLFTKDLSTSVRLVIVSFFFHFISAVWLWPSPTLTFRGSKVGSIQGRNSFTCYRRPRSNANDHYCGFFWCHLELWWREE